MMKKRAFKKNLALGVLIACSLTGSVYAENVNVVSGAVKDDDPVITVGSGESFSNAGTVTASDSITIGKGQFTNSGTINTGTLDILGGGHNSIAFNGGTINASNKIIYQGTQSDHYTLPLINTILDTPELVIQGTSQKNQVGLLVSDPQTLTSVGKITINSLGGKTGLIIKEGSNIEIKAPVYLHGVDTEDARIEVYEGATLTVDNIISEAGKTKVQLNGDGTTAILNNITVQNDGNFPLQTLGDAEQTNTFKLNTITVGDEAQFKTSIYNGCSKAVITGDDVTIDLGYKAKADFGGVGDGSKKDWRGDMINFQVDKLTINLDSTDEYNYANLAKYQEDYSKGVYIHVNDKYDPRDPAIGLGQIKVVGAGTANTGDLENDLQRLAYVVKITHELDGQEGTELPEILVPEGITVEQKPGGIEDGGTGTVDKDGDVTDIKPTKNPDVYGAAEIGALGLLSWRTELDDMNRRLGELRDSAGEHGLWVRMIRGKTITRASTASITFTRSAMIES